MSSLAHRTLWVGVLLGAALPAVAVEQPLPRRWRDGPVRYLLTEEEYDRYGRLGTPETRSAFVERFWKRRDPDPRTAENEFRQRFEVLSERANREFAEGTSPGWRTDRGRVLILLGEPDSVRRDAGEARGRDREIWTYGHPPGGGSAPLEIFFYRNRQGRFALRPETLHEPILDPVDRERERQRVREQVRSENLRLSASAVERLTDFLLGPRSLAPFADVRPEHRSPKVRAPSRRGPPGDDAADLYSSAMREAAYFFRSADGSVLAMLAREFQPEDAPEGATAPSGSDPYVARAWIVDGAGRSPVGRDALDEVRLEPQPSAPDDDSVLFIGRIHLEPGSYGLRYAVGDSLHRSLAIRSVELRVPELSLGRLSASSIVPAERFGKISEGESTPFAVGSEEVVPRPGGRFRHGEPLRVYLQVYDAAVDPFSRKSRVDVRFRFEFRTRRGFRAFKKPFLIRGAEGASMGLALPVGDWPSGDYRVVVDLRDQISGARTSTEGTFTVTD